MWYLLADANGFGWWDSDMEGVDSEAVGYGEAWEGVGSISHRVSTAHAALSVLSLKL